MTISFLIFVLVVLIVAGLIAYIIRQIPLAAPWSNVAAGVVFLIALLIILQRSGVMGSA